jgi:lipid-A-disaccharide synthase
MAQRQVIIVCGEPSGDLHAGELARALKQLDPRLEISAVGGTQLARAGARVFHDIQGLAVMGLFDALKKLPRFLALKKDILRQIEKINPAALILVDFSGFNLRLAKAINNALPIIYYISPQVWASRSKRAQTIKRYTARMIVIFRFEQEFYARRGINVDYVGHPLLDTARPQMSKEIFLRNLGLSADKPVIALLPGSRPAEIERMLPLMLAAGESIRQKIPQAQFIISRPAGLPLNAYARALKKSRIEAKISEGMNYDCLHCADFALICSGTATLEALIMETPHLLIYKMGLLSYIFYRPQVKVPYIGIGNIVAGELIVPEFIQFRARPRAVSQEALRILLDPAARQEMVSALRRIKALLGQPGAAQRAAYLILDTLNRGHPQN